ncbi:hypothetical protein ES332_D01G079800v1 [Gossypium tomentosum]|uniref:Uncharacterized protein n=1 Tax=Gossypium tomentosum TaxID=34277 RepID=A0A5D2M6Q4_GOSTO|nr:hypothetical protein ES332_D01G079800v1 [Gossypium tomentosum]
MREKWVFSPHRVASLRSQTSQPAKKKKKKTFQPPLRPSRTTEEKHSNGEATTVPSL